ncbi:hypothetical protein GCM10023185_07010 [Hymenobacter saemangeumensis]|uniref:DUF695 domain-containing protein n=1 Tax=Hymenobacter saemangeumensis TaxID=1084522 RepID=A0ABP8I2B9_9BACT
MLHKLFPQLCNHLRAAVPALGTIDIDMAQLDYEDQEPIQYPAVFIDLENIAWGDLGAGIQKGPATLRFTVAVEVSEESYEGAQGRDNMLNRLEVVQQVHKALQHHQGDGYGPLVRTSYRRDRVQHPEAWCLAMGYVSELIDNDGAQELASVTDAALSVGVGAQPAPEEEDDGFILPLIPTPSRA